MFRLEHTLHARVHTGTLAPFSVRAGPISVARTEVSGKEDSFGKNEGTHWRSAETMTSTARRCLRRCNTCGHEANCAWTSHKCTKNGARSYCGFMKIVRKAENRS